MSQTMREALRELLEYCAEKDPMQGDEERDDPRVTAAAQALKSKGAEPVTINGEAPNAHNLLAALVDIYDDGQKNPPEHRSYVDGAWAGILTVARKFLAPRPAAAAPAAQAYMCQETETPCTRCTSTCEAAQGAEPVGFDVDPKETVGQLAERVGAWETPEGFVSFGSWMALAAFRHHVLVGAAKQWKQMEDTRATLAGEPVEAIRQALRDLSATMGGDGEEPLTEIIKDAIAALAGAAQGAEPSALRGALEEIAAMEYDKWSNGARAGEIARNALAMQSQSIPVTGATVADRLDAMADREQAGSQASSDLYAAATVWRKHLKAGAAQGAEPVAYALRFPSDTLICLSTVFDTRAEAQDYLETCSEGTEIVPLYADATCSLRRGQRITNAQYEEIYAVFRGAGATSRDAEGGALRVIELLSMTPPPSKHPQETQP